MRRCGLLLIGLAALGGCEVTDPYRAEGRWRPAGVNETNLRAMVADPAHLQTGVDDRRADGHLAAAAVDRLRRDRVRPLPASSVARISVSDGGAPQPTPSGGAGGAR